MNGEMNPIKRYLKRPTRKNAIDAMCVHCMGGTANHLEAGFRQSISACSSKGCPLYRFRPFVDSRTLQPAKKGVQNG